MTARKKGAKKITVNAPKILDYLCDDCRSHFEKVKSLLTGLGVEYTINPDIVRGLDYYTRTVFEFVSTDIGAQGTVCGGGRYDKLISELGGGEVPAIGFAAGLERLILLMDNTSVPFPEKPVPAIYIGGMDENSRSKAFELVSKLRQSGVAAECDLMARSVKAQLKYADKCGAKFVAIIGETELESGKVDIKKMADGTRENIALADICEYIGKNN